MLRLLKYLKKKDWIMAVLCVGFIVCQVWLDLTLPDYMQKITTLSQTPNSEMSEIWLAGGMMILCAVGSFACAIIAGYFAAKIAASFAHTLRLSVYDKVQSFSMEEIDGFSTASLITRSTNDITQVQTLLAMGLQVIVKAPITAVWAVIKILDKNWTWSVATAVAVGIVVIIVCTVLVLTYSKFTMIQKQTDHLNNVTRENLTGVRVIRAYNAEAYQEEKFDKVNTELSKTQLFTNRTMAVMQPAMQGIMNGLVLAIYIIGAMLVSGAAVADKLSLFSDTLAFSQYAMQVIGAFMSMIMIFLMLPRSLVSARRIGEVIESNSEIADGNYEQQTWMQGEVEFRDVSFGYGDAEENVLSHISFKAESGETIAFIGSTGSGKSTLVNLIPRFYDVSEGEIRIDGINVKNYKLKDLRKKIGYISQKPVLFSGTIQSNIAFGDSRYEINKSAVAQSLEMSQCRDFVDGLEKKELSVVEKGGANYSGGQKQRLSIARAIYRNPEIFIFDDSFSALDYKTDKELRTQLKAQTSGVTTFIVAQRIGTIMDADKIVVLDNGKIAGMGKHKELLKNCEVYREIAFSQLSKEELAV